MCRLLIHRLRKSVKVQLFLLFVFAFYTVTDEFVWPRSVAQLLADSGFSNSLDLPSLRADFARTVHRFNCSRLLYSNSADADADAAAHPTPLHLEISPLAYLYASCSDIVADRYVVDVGRLAAEEREFPLALQFLVYKDVWQFERLLRAVYRPQNFYCIHVDRRASRSVAAAIHKLASCFDNVYVPAELYAIQYSKITQTLAEISCMRELYQRSNKWKYLINLTGQEWPLKTMWQLVRVLKALNGSNNMEASNMEGRRLRQLLPFATKYNITPVKGATHILVVRDFVQFALEHPIAVKMRDWLKFAPNPDETLFPTLNHNPRLGAPGGYLGPPRNDAENYPYINRLKNWGDLPCHGFRRHGVCIWGVGDLPFVIKPSKYLIVNKLVWNFQHWALDCIEDWYWTMTLDELATGRVSATEFDVQYYANLGVTKLHQ